jgi:hypothetical protein
MLAMLHWMLCAFSGTSLANLGAERANRIPMVVAACNRRCGQAAYIGTLHVHFDAANHRFWAIFIETGDGAFEAGSRTFVASQQAFFLGLTQHFNLPFCETSVPS